jgi:hypothetical protein
MLIGSWKSNPTSSGYVVSLLLLLFIRHVSENIDTFRSHLGVLKTSDSLSPLNEWMNGWISHISFTFGCTKTSDSLSPLNEWMDEFHTFHSHLGVLKTSDSLSPLNEWMDEFHTLHSHLGILKQVTPCRHLMNEWMDEFHTFHSHLGVLKQATPCCQWMNFTHFIHIWVY